VSSPKTDRTFICNVSKLTPLFNPKYLGKSYRRNISNFPQHYMASHSVTPNLHQRRREDLRDLSGSSYIHTEIPSAFTEQKRNNKLKQSFSLVRDLPHRPDATRLSKTCSYVITVERVCCYGNQKTNTLKHRSFPTRTYILRRLSRPRTHPIIGISLQPYNIGNTE
jgi:hypothetical protein